MEQPLLAAETLQVLPKVRPELKAARKRIVEAQHFVMEVRLVELQKTQAGFDLRFGVDRNSVARVPVSQSNQEVIQITQQPATLHASLIVELRRHLFPAGQPVE